MDYIQKVNLTRSLAAVVASISLADTSAYLLQRRVDLCTIEDSAIPAALLDIQNRLTDLASRIDGLRTSVIKQLYSDNPAPNGATTPPPPATGTVLDCLSEYPDEGGSDPTPSGGTLPEDWASRDTPNHKGGRDIDRLYDQPGALSAYSATGHDSVLGGPQAGYD